MPRPHLEWARFEAVRGMTSTPARGSGGRRAAVDEGGRRCAGAGGYRWGSRPESWAGGRSRRPPRGGGATTTGASPGSASRRTTSSRTARSCGTGWPDRRSRAGGPVGGLHLPRREEYGRAAGTDVAPARRPGCLGRADPVDVGGDVGVAPGPEPARGAPRRVADGAPGSESRGFRHRRSAAGRPHRAAVRSAGLRACGRAPGRSAVGAARVRVHPAGRRVPFPDLRGLGRGAGRPVRP